MCKSPQQIVETRFRAAFLHPRYWPTWLLAGLLFLLAYAPNGLRVGLARLAAGIYPRLKPRRVAIIDINLALSFPDMTAEARRALRHRNLFLTAYAMVDLGRQWFRSPNYLLSQMDVEGREYFDSARKSGGVTLLTGHSSGLEWLACYCTIRWSGSSIYKPFKGNALLDWLFTRARTRFSSQMYLRRHGLRPHLRNLRAGQAFYYIADEDLGLESAAFAPLFGQSKATLSLLGRILRLSGRPVLPCMGMVDPERGRYRLVFLPLVTEVPEEAKESARITNQLLETLIRHDPAQYMWHMKLFKTRPEGESSPYS